MAHLSNATLTPRLSRRRYADPPALWAIVAVGSLILHGVFLLGMRWFNIHIALAQPETDSIPIEMIELSPAAAPTPASRTAASSPAAAPPSATQPTDTPDIAVQSQTTNHSPAGAIAPPPPARNSATATPPPTRVNSQSIRRPQVSPTPQPTGMRSPTPTPNTAGSILPSANGGSTRSGNPPASPNPNEQPDSSEEPASSTPATVDPSLAGSTGHSNNTIPPVTVAREVSPTRVVASLSVSPIPASENPTDLLGPGGQIAQPKDPNQVFQLDPTNSDCVLDPDSFNFLEKTLEFYVEIETIAPDLGRVAGEPRLRGESSGSDSYDRLAACLLQRVEFHPALTQTPTGSSSPPLSEAIVQIKISLAAN